MLFELRMDPLVATFLSERWVPQAVVYGFLLNSVDILFHELVYVTYRRHSVVPQVSKLFKRSSTIRQLRKFIPWNIIKSYIYYHMDKKETKLFFPSEMQSLANWGAVLVILVPFTSLSMWMGSRSVNSLSTIEWHCSNRLLKNRSNQ